jgi:methyl-accepting chemotaxis protein
MVKLNRIGNKLGLAGALGVLLAVGMVANQWLTESAVTEANKRGDKQQRVADNALAANVGLRQMQVAGRTLRLAKTTAEIDANTAEMRRAAANEARQIDAAIGDTVFPENLERLKKIKSVTASYEAGIEELAKTQTAVLAAADKRSKISAEWSKLFGSAMALATPAIRHEAEVLLYQADSTFNEIRAAALQFGATGEEEQKQIVGKRTVALNDMLGHARDLTDDKAFRQGVDSLISVVARFTAANDELLRLENLKTEALTKRTTPFLNEAGELMTVAIEVAQKNNDRLKAEAASELLQANRINFVLAIVVMTAIVGSVLFSFFGVAWPMTRLNGALGKMAAGDLDIAIPGADRGDEIGDLAKTVTVIRGNAEQKARDEAEAQTRQDQAAAKQRKADMIRMADDFEGAVGEIVETVSSASTELEASASTLTATAVRSEQLTTMVAAASEEASANVQSVASATEEMASSVNEISRQVQESARMAGDAVDQARKTNDRVSELSKAASRIGDVVELINTIAGQTNLLALNATIEAARAGEAGRGFAVVASEVKALAEQTAKATGEIGQQITGIQAATQESVNAIREISGTIEKLSEISSTIAAAVEEQGAATQEISRNVQQAAQGTQQVSANITDVQRGASETGTASSQVLSAAQSLSGDSNRLKLEVGKFLNSVRAA